MCDPPTTHDIGAGHRIILFFNDEVTVTNIHKMSAIVKIAGRNLIRDNSGRKCETSMTASIALG
jgi:hypothetical protein